MANPTSRTELVEYVRRALGEPVIDINIDDEQLEDRIDDAINYIHEFHCDGTEHVLIDHVVTATTIKVDETLTEGMFVCGDGLVGQTSGATAKIWGQTTSSILVYRISGTFQEGETVTSAGGIATISTSTPTVPAIVLGDIDKRYIDMPDTILSVIKVFPVSMTSSKYYLFDVQYHMISDILWSVGTVDMTYYTMTKSYINLINELLVGEKIIRFVKHASKLHVDMNWGNAILPDQHLLIEAYKFIDPETYTSFYNNRMLKALATAMVGRQWGTNLGKFNGIVLPGGTTLNGEGIYNKYLEEENRVREEIQKSYVLPARFFIG